MAVLVVGPLTVDEQRLFPVLSMPGPELLDTVAGTIREFDLPAGEFRDYSATRSD